MTAQNSKYTAADESPLPRIRKSLETYDIADLLAAAAALQLIPENADHMLRIEALAQVASSIPIVLGKPRISTPRLRELLNSPPLSDVIAAAEDPFPNPFVEEVAFFGGSYRVLPGLTAGAVFVLRNIANVLLRKGKLSKGFLADAYVHLRALLALSDEVAKSADLTRGVTAPSSASVLIPNASKLLRLKDAVRFSRLQLQQLLHSHSVPPGVLDGFTAPPTESNLEDFTFDEGPEPLLKKPIVSLGESLVVAIPEALAVTARNCVISLAVWHKEQDEFARLYLNAVFRSVVLSLRHAGIPQLDYEFQSPLAIPGCRDALFQMDDDKFLYLLLLTDTLDAYQTDEVSGIWETPGLETQIAERFRKIEAEIYAKWPAPNELLCLLVSEGVGRTHMMRFEEEPTSVSEFLYVNAHDLETISLLEGNNHLALWRFARQRNLIRKTVKVIAWSTLDEFALYRKNKYSYYLSDEKPYNLISVSPDYSTPLRCEAVKIHDRHTVPHYRSGHYVEVSSLHGTGQIPIYQPLPPIGKKIECYVEAYSIPIWVVGARPTRGTAAHYEYREFCAAVAYWLWQLAPSLSPVISGVHQYLPRLTVYIQLPDDPESLKKGNEKVTQEEPISKAIGDGSIHLDLTASLSPLLRTGDNAGERKVISALLTGLRQLVPQLSDVLTDLNISRLIDTHAPLGPKKMMLLLDLAENPRLDPRSLPPFRAIQDGDLDDVLTNVGFHLTGTLGMPAGAVPDEKANDLLNEVVRHCYKDFVQLVSTLSPTGLLEWLVSQNEAVIREDALRSLTITTRLACFESDPDIITSLQKELPLISQTALASRFLIEYVVARPPRGLRRSSNGLNDRLRALAYEIITFGMHSDSVRYGLTDKKLSILDSGRLGIVDKLFKSAMDAHSRDHIATQIAVGSRTFSEHWNRSGESSHGQSDLIARADAACKAEFGFSLTDLMSAVGGLLNIGYEIDPGVAVAQLETVVARLRQELKWDVEKIRGVIDFLSLRERDDFLVPPAGFRREHIYPWRFNRPLSYVRRPLLLRGGDQNPDVIWGNRHLEAFRANFVSIVMTAKFQPTSPEMKLFFGKRTNQRGREFNDRVAKFFEDRPNTAVKSRVMTIDKLNLANLGDIDVLCADLGRRVLYILECKDLSMARTPFELAMEIRELMVGTDDKKSLVEKHVARVDFVRQHLGQTVRWLGGNSKKSWKVRPMIVVDEPLMGPHIKACPLPVVAIEVLRDHLK